jgi:Zn-dependent protease with chaperone function
MNKLKWAILLIYTSTLALLRMLKLAILSYFFTKKDLYISVWFGGLANNIIQLAHSEYLSNKFCFTIHVPPHNFLKVTEKYDVHDIEPMEFQQKMYFPSTPSTVIILTLALFRRMFWRFDILPFSPNFADYRDVMRQKIFPIIPHRTDDLIKDDTLVIHMRS